MEHAMTRPQSKDVYHRLVVLANPTTVIWLVDDAWHLVQKAIGTLDTSLLPGHYFIELDAVGAEGIAYPVDLFGDLRLSQSALMAGPTCRRQAPKFSEQ
jgi:hypothetical protein